MMKVLVVLMLVCSVCAVQGESTRTKLRELTASLDQLKVEVKYLRAENKGKQVAFSASLVDTVAQTLGPFNVLTPIVYKHVITNIGNAYNPHTGVFTAPLRGAYHFEWYVIGAVGRTTSAVLVKNSEPIFIAYEQQLSGRASSSNGVTLPLEAGDVVFVRLYPGTTVFDNVNHHTTFSGHLIFTM